MAMCNGMCACKMQREQIEKKIKDLLIMLNNGMPQQEFFSIKNEILGLIDELK